MVQTTVRRLLPLAIATTTLVAVVWLLKSTILPGGSSSAVRTGSTLTASRPPSEANPNPTSSTSAEPVPTEDAIALDKTLSSQSGQIHSVAISRDANILASGGSNDTIKLWDLDVGAFKQALVQNNAGVIDTLGISPDGRTLASSGWGGGGSIDVWHLDTNKHHLTLPKNPYYVTALLFNRDGEHLISGSSDSTIKVWHWHEAELTKTIQGSANGGISTLALSPDEKLLASGSRRGSIDVWDLNSGKLLRTLTGHSDKVTALSFSKDGKTVISGSSDNTIKLWNWSTGKPLEQDLEHDSGITSIAIRQDGKTFASASLDGTVKLWDQQTGQLLKTHKLSQHSGERFTLMIEPNNQILVSGYSANAVKIWRIP